MYSQKTKGDICSHKRAFMLDNRFRRLIQNPNKILYEYIHEGDTAVDLGCGPGYFTLEMARLAGERGKVFAVDLQEQMLSKMMKKAVLNHMDRIISPVQCTEADLGLPRGTRADFALAYYMVHETPDPARFFGMVREVLHPEGQLLVVEPPFHVSAAEFARLEKIALNAGFSIRHRPRGKGGRSILLS